METASSEVFVLASEKGDAEAAARSVSGLGFRASTYSNPEACLGDLSKSLPLALIIDLPEQRAYEVCQRVKESWRHVPVLMVTRTDQAHEIMYCWRAAADDFLRKPVTPETLGPKLRAIQRRLPTDPGDPALTGRIVLLAESSRFYRNNIGGNLEHAGLQVLYATEDEEAIALFEEHADRVDAFLIGMLTPALTGLRVAAAIRGDPRSRKKPMLLMSGAEQVDPENRALAESLTGSMLLDKRELPFDLILSKIFTTLKPNNVMELRSAERVPFFSVVEFAAASGEKGLGFSYDVSSGGIFIRTLTPAAKGQSLTLTMKLVAQETRSQGVVAWANPYRPRATFACPVGMGVRLTELSPQLSAQIAGLVRHRLMGRPPKTPVALSGSS